jgi:hypothetical protein
VCADAVQLTKIAPQSAPSKSGWDGQCWHPWFSCCDWQLGIVLCPGRYAYCWHCSALLTRTPATSMHLSEEHALPTHQAKGSWRGGQDPMPPSMHCRGNHAGATHQGMLPAAQRQKKQHARSAQQGAHLTPPLAGSQKGATSVHMPGEHGMFHATDQHFRTGVRKPPPSALW